MVETDSYAFPGLPHDIVDVVTVLLISHPLANFPIDPLGLISALDQPRFGALLWQIEAASMAQHMGMALNADACRLASTPYNDLYRVRRQKPAAL
jgi:hypothetical protein